MTENDIKSMGLVLSLDQCIKTIEGMIESAKDRLKYARSYTSKKNHKKTMVFYEAVCYHLKRLKKIESETKN